MLEPHAMRLESARLRVILPISYGVVAAVLFGGCFLHLGHSPWCQYFLDSMFPANILCRTLLNALASWSVPERSPEAWRTFDTLLQVVVPLLVTIAQYYLLGLVIDQLRSRRSRDTN